MPSRHPGDQLVVASALPLVVELGAEPYYYQSGYYYCHHNDRYRDDYHYNYPQESH